MDDKDVEVFVTGVSGKMEINHDSSGPTEVDQKEDAGPEEDDRE